MKAKDVMTKDVITVGPGHNIRSAARTMLDHGVSGLPVIGDDGELVGILTEGDLLRRMELGGAPSWSAAGADRTEAIGSYVRDHSWRVQDVMSPDAIAADAETPLDQIARIMEENTIKRVPITRGGRLVGMVSRADLLRAIIAAPGDRAAPGDASLKRAVEARLSADLGLRAPQVRVRVEGGHVVLSGTVETDAMREAARVAAEGVRGNLSTVNNLSIAPEAAASKDPS